jgi:hypothetical protein
MANVEASSKGAELGYIAMWVKRDPLDQTDLKNGINAILSGGGGSF